MRKFLLFLTAFAFAYFYGPEHVISGVIDVSIQFYQGQLPGQSGDLDKLADLATIAGFFLGLWIFFAPPSPTSGLSSDHASEPVTASATDDNKRRPVSPSGDTGSLEA